MGALLACRSEDTIDDQQLREDVLYCKDDGTYSSEKEVEVVPI